VVSIPRSSGGSVCGSGRLAKPTRHMRAMWLAVHVRYGGARSLFFLPAAEFADLAMLSWLLCAASFGAPYYVYV
jgi:hypothetical protein